MPTSDSVHPGEKLHFHTQANWIFTEECLNAQKQNCFISCVRNIIILFIEQVVAHNVSEEFRLNLSLVTVHRQHCLKR